MALHLGCTRAPCPAFLSPFSYSATHFQVVGACLPSMETAKRMTLELTAGTWWPPCPHGGPV